MTDREPVWQQACIAALAEGSLLDRAVLATEIARFAQVLETRAWSAVDMKSPAGSGVAAVLGERTGLTTPEAEDLLRVSSEIAVGLPGVLSAQERGRFGPKHVEKARRALRGASTELAGLIDSQIANETTTGETAVQIGQRVRGLVATAEPAAADERRRKRFAARCVTFTSLEDDEALLQLRGPEVWLTEMRDSLRAQARLGWAGRPGHDRDDAAEVGVPARMLDAAYELVTGLLPDAAGRGLGPADLGPAGGDDHATTAVVPIEFPLLRNRRQSRCRPRQAVVHVVTEQAVLAGTSDAPGLLGGGPVSAHRVRELAATATIVNVVVDSEGRLAPQPEDELLDSAASTYTPSRAMRRYLARRDWTCRFPGCSAAAHLCDVDHVLAWGRGGRTVRRNLVCVCSLHHQRVKHCGLWSVTGDAEGTLTWHGPEGWVGFSRPAVLSPRRRWGSPP